MADIIDVSGFDPVPILEVGDPVKGGITGESNKQAIVLAGRTKYLKDEVEKTQKSIDDLTPDDIGAEPAGTANAIMTEHHNDADPHAQYLTKTAAAAEYLTLSGANLPGGGVILDENGKIPSDLLDMIKSSYVAVADETARLALPETDNLTIAAQVDIDTLFYLNGGLDPSNPTNWVRGQSATVSGVARVFGRTGDIEARAGDYNADQITETANKTFVTPAQKNEWTQKQEKLVNGQNIKTFKGVNLLGNGDFSPTPDQLGCAAKTHTHPTSDIVELDPRIRSVVGDSLLPGPGVVLNYHSVTGKTTITSTGGSGGSGEGGLSYIHQKVEGSQVNQNHSFNFAEITEFNDAFALISENGATNQIQVLETYNAANAINYKYTPFIRWTGTQAEVYNGGKLSLIPDGSFNSAAIDVTAEKFKLEVSQATIIPTMSSNTTPTGYSTIFSTEYSNFYRAWQAFNPMLAGGVSDCWASSTGVTPAAPQWLGITLPEAKTVTGYAIQNRIGDVNNYPTKWRFQGSNDDGTTWENIVPEIADTDGTVGKVRTFTVNPTKAYRSYRVYITEQAGVNTSFVAIQKMYLYSSGKLLFLDENGTTGYGLNGGALVTYPNVTPAQIDANGFTNTGDLAGSLFAGKNISKIIGTKQIDVSLGVVPSAQIIIPKKILSGKSWAAIKAANTAHTLTGAGSLHSFVITRDGVDWWAFKSGVWVNIGGLTPDKAGADKLVAQGMTTVEFGDVTPAQYKLFYGDNPPDFFAYAEALKIVNYDATAKVDNFQLTVDNVSSWRRCSPSEVEIRWRSEMITFRTVVAGDFIFSYQLP